MCGPLAHAFRKVVIDSPRVQGCLMADTDGPVPAARDRGVFAPMASRFVQAFNSDHCRVSMTSANLAERTMPPRSDGKAAAILMAAERLFAERGYHAVTIREIAAEAQVPLALVGYHHGPKQLLFEAVFTRWQSTIDERVRELEAALAAGGRSLLRRIVEAFVSPVLRLRASPDGRDYAVLVARELAYASPESDRVLRRHFDPMAHRFIDALAVALPQATRAELAWVYQFALGALLHHLIDTRVERLSRGEAVAHDPAAAALLVRFVEGGIHAALGKRAAPAARRSRSRSRSTARRQT